MGIIYAVKGINAIHAFYGINTQYAFSGIPDVLHVVFPRVLPSCYSWVSCVKWLKVMLSR
jgi:hypothetical protein